MIVGILAAIIVVLSIEVDQIREELQKLKRECRNHGIKKTM